MWTPAERQVHKTFIKSTENSCRSAQKIKCVVAAKFYFKDFLAMFRMSNNLCRYET